MTLGTEELLLGLRRDDGGFGPSADAESEAEPTALAALALDDGEARAWLVRHQSPDGAWITGSEQIRSDSATPLGVLVVEGTARERALDYVVAHRAVQAGPDDRIPHDPGTRGWGWTPHTFGWVEPTARAVLALKRHRPSAEAEIADGLAVLADRETKGGGWNYGNRVAFAEVLRPFLQTTAAGVMAVHDTPTPLRERGVAVLRRLWRDEPGLLGWAMTLVALRLCDVDDSDLDTGLRKLVAGQDRSASVVALGWAALALGDGWRKLRVEA